MYRMKIKHKNPTTSMNRFLLTEVTLSGCTVSTLDLLFRGRSLLSKASSDSFFSFSFKANASAAALSAIWENETLLTLDKLYHHIPPFVLGEL